MRRVTLALLLLAGSLHIATAQTSGQPGAQPPPIEGVIVYIECKSPNGQTTSKGTGVLVSGDGAVLTAKHVAPVGYACLGGIGTAATTPTRKLNRDPRQAPVDAMLLRFVQTGGEVFPFVRYRKLEASLRGKPISAYGFPGTGVGDVFQTDGTIAQTNIDDRGIFGTSALQSSGMSGGPVVLKEDGNLIGIIVGANFDPTTGAPASYGVLASSLVASVFDLTPALQAFLPTPQIMWGDEVGGPGGDLFETSCRTTEALVGLFGRTGSGGDVRVFSIGPVCALASSESVPGLGSIWDVDGDVASHGFCWINSRHGIRNNLPSAVCRSRTGLAMG